MTKKSRGSDVDLRERLLMYNSAKEFFENEPSMYARFKKGIKDFYHFNQQKKALDFNPDKKVFYIYGGNAAERDERARELCPEPFVRIGFKNGFLLNYNGERNCILEEFRPSQTHVSHFVKLTDKYSSVQNVRWSDTIFDADVLCVTSPLPPDQIYRNEEGALDQIRRRVIPVLIKPGENN
jgi:hypothetical protein